MSNSAAFLQKQMEAFASSVSDSASKVSQKRVVGTATASRPSPAPSTSSNTSKPSVDPLKRKRPQPPADVVYSQPANTGTGKHLMTQVTYAIEYLKQKDKPIPFDDVFNYLSIQDDEVGSIRKNMKAILQTHPRVEYDSAGIGGKGLYRFRPTHNVRSGDELEAYLQSQTTAQGIPVKELKDGWPGALDAIDDLEAEGKLLVTRNKKDNTAKMVWPNDPSLRHEVDDEFKTLWHNIKLPTEAVDLRTQLESFGLTPTSQIKAPVVTKMKEKKKKASRRGGKTTNTHMQHILKDYSAKRPVK